MWPSGGLLKVACETDTPSAVKYASLREITKIREFVLLESEVALLGGRKTWPLTLSAVNTLWMGWFWYIRCNCVELQLGLFCTSGVVQWDRRGEGIWEWGPRCSFNEAACFNRIISLLVCVQSRMKYENNIASFRGFVAQTWPNFPLFGFAFVLLSKN